jgi:hypothetical protein
VDTTVKMATRSAKFVLIRRIVVETAPFDAHRLMNPDVHGIAYRRGPLYRMDLRRYLWEKFCGRCVYCKKELGSGWQADHVVPKSKGGSDRPSNRVAACESCNQGKGSMTVSEFGHPEVELLAGHGYAPAAIVTSMRMALVVGLGRIAPTVETDGATTARNREMLGLSKTHANDAISLLDPPRRLVLPSVMAFIVARPCGTRRLVNGPHGGHAVRLPREVRGFRQWDAVRWGGRVCYVKGRRRTGSFLLSDLEGKKIKDGIGAKHFRLVQRVSSLQGEMRHIVREARIPPRTEVRGFLRANL